MTTPFQTSILSACVHQVYVLMKPQWTFCVYSCNFRTCSVCAWKGECTASILYCAYGEIPTEVCIAASISSLRIAACVKFPEFEEQRAGYQLAFEAKVYNFCERRYEQFYIWSSVLLRSWCCLPEFSVCSPG